MNDQKELCRKECSGQGEQQTLGQQVSLFWEGYRKPAGPNDLPCSPPFKGYLCQVVGTIEGVSLLPLSALTSFSILLSLVRSGADQVKQKKREARFCSCPELGEKRPPSFFLPGHYNDWGSGWVGWGADCWCLNWCFSSKPGVGPPTPAAGCGNAFSPLLLALAEFATTGKKHLPDTSLLWYNSYHRGSIGRRDLGCEEALGSHSSHAKYTTFQQSCKHSGDQCQEWAWDVSLAFHPCSHGSEQRSLQMAAANAQSLYEAFAI